MKIYAFDVDETLECSGGPIGIHLLEELRAQGHLVGYCGNWALAVQQWYITTRENITFMGPMGTTKDLMLAQIKRYIQAEEYVMVGNILGVSGHSDDKGAAALAGWRFIQEANFAKGER